MAPPFGTLIPNVETFYSTNLAVLASDVEDFLQVASPAHYLVDLEFFAANMGGGRALFICTVVYKGTGTLNTQSVTAVITSDLNDFDAQVQAVLDLAGGETRYETIAKFGMVGNPTIGLPMPCALIYKRRDP